MAAGAAEESKLKRCLEVVIGVVNEAIPKLHPQAEQEQPSADQVTSPAIDTNIHTFTLDTEEEEQMDDLKTKLESVLNEHLPCLSQVCRKYLFNFLHKYNYDSGKKVFTSSFNMGILHPFSRDLQGMLASINAFQAAWDGNRAVVKDFIQKYPTAKDKPGLWGTTLLYSAARNNRLSLVEYLVATARCSVNAQNQQHLEKALSTSTITAEDFEVRPTAASTALHGACYNGYFDIVKYLIEHGADYFIKNHAQETPIMNAGSKPDILNFFRDFLILGYTPDSNTFPDKTIQEQIEQKQQQVVDCIWEYKPFADQQWFPFSAAESDELQKTLIVKPDEQFKLEVRLNVRSGVYSVSMIQFLRSGKDLDQTQNLAWVRCRGSSLLNFDCYSLWQLMFVRHPKAIHDTSPSLHISEIPTIYNSSFKIQLNSWYTCDATTNSQLEQAMNYRRKLVSLDVDFISDDELKFNLHTFQFANDQKTIWGFLRWIPKMISNNERNKGKITSIDHFETLTNLDPIPLTRSRLKQVSQPTNFLSTTPEEKFGKDIDEDDSTSQSISNENAEDDGNFEIPNKTFEPIKRGTWSLKDMAINDDGALATPASNNNSPLPHSGASSSSPITTTSVNSDDTNDVKIDDYFNQTVSMFRPQQQASLLHKSNSSADLLVAQAMNAELEREKKELEARLIAERAKVDEQLNSSAKKAANQEQKLAELMASIESMHIEQDKIKEREVKRQQIQSSIKTLEYNNIQTEVVNDFLTPKFEIILNHLRKLTPHLDAHFIDKIPKCHSKQNIKHTPLLSPVFKLIKMHSKLSYNESGIY